MPAAGHNPTVRPAPDSRDYLLAALVAAVLFALYAAGASPTIYVGDSGELVAAVATLGIPHPSGYPLYVILGKLWTLAVPIGSIAYRMSLFSAAAAAFACAALYLTARGAGTSRPAAALGAGLLAFAPSFWGEATVQRVYTLNALFVVLAIACAIRWQRTRSAGALALAFFVCGLGATNHTVMAIVAIALGCVVALETIAAVSGSSVLARAAGVDMEAGAALRHPMVAVRHAAVAAFAFAAGLLPYLYLLIRSRMDPRLDWGNPETFSALVDVIVRRDFWERAYIESAGDLVTIGADWLRSLFYETAWAGAALAVAGAWAARRTRFPLAFMLLVMAGNLAALALHGSRSDIFIWHRYYIPSYVVVAALAAAGADWVLARVPVNARWTVLALPALGFIVHRAEFDRSRYRIAEDFANAVLESTPPGGHLIATDDNVLFVLIYLHLVENRRPDVDLILQGVGKADLPPLRFDPDEDPLYFTHHPNWDLPELEIVPNGVIYRAWRRGRQWPEPFLPRTALAGEDDPRVPKDYLTQNLIGHFHYTLGFTFEQRDWKRAREEFRKAAAASPENDVLFYNLGLVYVRNGFYDEALAAFARSHDINPRHIASLSKPRADQKMAEVRAEQVRLQTIVAELRTGHSDLPPQGTAAYDTRLAELLEQKGEKTAARGYRLRALESAAS
jgi:tetratricopeptide (TPR) repeat protein